MTQIHHHWIKALFKRRRAYQPFLETNMTSDDNPMTLFIEKNKAKRVDLHFVIGFYHGKLTRSFSYVIWILYTYTILYYTYPMRISYLFLGAKGLQVCERFDVPSNLTKGKTNFGMMRTGTWSLAHQTTHVVFSFILQKKTREYTGYLQINGWCHVDFIFSNLGVHVCLSWSNKLGIYLMELEMMVWPSMM